MKCGYDHVNIPNKNEIDFKNYEILYFSEGQIHEKIEKN